MGRTIPSYRIATEIERWKWKLFRQALDKDKKIMVLVILAVSIVIVLGIIFGIQTEF